MVRVTFLRSAGMREGFSCEGHAGCGEAGRDIVCSAVSALTQTAVDGLQSVLRIPCGTDMDDGELHCILDRDATSEQRQKANVLLEILERGLCAAADSYPKYLKICYREV